MPRRRASPFSPASHEPALSRPERRATGVYYTPPEIVRLIVELTLSSQRAPLAPRVYNAPPAAPPLRILDPACGAGEFLAAAHHYAVQAGIAATLMGVDIDPAAIATARRRLLEMNREPDPENLIVGDALGDALANERLLPASFDVILGNPPYVNIRQLAKALSRARIEALRQRYQTARGNFDLYILFIERSLELLRPGGRCGLIIPNKWATLDYARPCRELLLKHATLERVIDLSDSHAFAKANVYPQVLIFRKEPPHATHAVRFSGGLQPIDQHSIPQRLLASVAISFAASLDVESRVATQSLGELATLSCGTAGFSAQRIASRLLDVEDGQTDAPNPAHFITSGNIDRYSIRLGNVRYLNRTYTQPRLPLVSPELTPAKQRLFASPKIVIAGMSQRLEAAWDARGLALGVQVFAASECRIDPFYLLALLNSKLLSYLFATRFAAKRLAGGYLSINKGQLARLPIATPLAGTKPGPGLPPLARQMMMERTEQLDASIDRLVYSLYRLTPAEIARVEQYFPQPSARAA